MRCALHAAALIMLFLPVSAAGASARAAFAKVRSLTGRSAVFDAWTARWVPLKAGDAVDDDALVRVNPGSRLVIDLTQALNGQPPPALAIDEPLVFRLGADQFRERRRVETVLAKTPKNSAAAVESVPPFLSLDEAWKTLAARLKNAGDAGAPAAGVPKPNALMDRGTSGTLTLTIPGEGAVMTASPVPQDLRLSWRAPQALSSAVHVYVWRKGEPRREIASTTLDHHYARIDGAGTYQIQVETADGKWRSSPHEVEITSPLAPEAAEDAKDSTGSPRGIKLLAPPPAFQILAARLPLVVGFQWALSRPLAMERIRYRLVVTRNGKDVARVDTELTSASVTLTRSGTYLWHVDASARPDLTQQPWAAGGQLSSGIGVIEILDGKAAWNPRAMLQGEGTRATYVEKLPSER